MIFRKIFLSLVLGGCQMVSVGWAKDCWVYFGTFTNATSRGIYASRLDLTTGKLSAPELAATAPNPNYLAVSPNGRWLYAVTRVDNFRNQAGGSVSVYAINSDNGKLRLIDEKFSGGAGPCHVSVDATGKTVLVANYSGGSVKSFHVNRDGTLVDGTVIWHHGSSANQRRQEAAHAHCFLPAPAGGFALACDLGLDRVMIYKYDETKATLTTNDPGSAAVTPGSGPRHLAFSPDGKTAYVVNEMACTVTVFAWDGVRGILAPRQTISLLPSDAPLTEAFTAAEIAVRPDGRFVYATVRGLNRVIVLAVSQSNGTLSWAGNVPCGGKVPRGMTIDPTGRWLIVANQASGDVVVFGINADTGQLTPTGQTYHVSQAVDVKFVPQ